MSYELKIYDPFKRAAKKLAKHYPSFKQDLMAFGRMICDNPLQGADLGGGLRKVRMTIKSKNAGKSGGARVIIAIVSTMGNDYVGLLFVYDKSEQESISEKDLMALKRECGIE